MAAAAAPPAACFPGLPVAIPFKVGSKCRLFNGVLVDHVRLDADRCERDGVCWQHQLSGVDEIWMSQYEDGCVELLHAATALQGAEDYLDCCREEEETPEEKEDEAGVPSFKGIRFNRGPNTWCMQLHCEGQQKLYKSGFSTAEEAARAWDDAARKIGRKELNFPDLARGETQAEWGRQEGNRCPRTPAIQRAGRSAEQSTRATTFKGISYTRNKGSWHAVIYVDGKAVSLGSFSTAEEAARAWDKAARKAGRTEVNFPDAARGETLAVRGRVAPRPPGTARKEVGAAAADSGEDDEEEEMEEEEEEPAAQRVAKRTRLQASSQGGGAAAAAAAATAGAAAAGAGAAAAGAGGARSSSGVRACVLRALARAPPDARAAELAAFLDTRTSLAQLRFFGDQQIPRELASAGVDALLEGYGAASGAGIAMARAYVMMAARAAFLGQ